MKLISKLGMASLSLVLLGSAFAAGCGGDDEEGLPTVDCSGTIPKFSEVALFSDSCSNCHGQDLAGTARNGAPVDINFDSYDSAKAHAEKAASEVYNGAMPPTGNEDFSEAQKQQLYLWSLCGTPQ